MKSNNLTVYDDKVEFNKGHILEALDRCHTLETLIDTLLVDHPAIIESGASGEVLALSERVSNIYQKVGELYSSK